MQTGFDALPDDALLRQRHLIGDRKNNIPGILPFSGPTLWRKVKAGDFPAPIKLNSGNMTAWRCGVVRKWLAAQGGEA